MAGKFSRGRQALSDRRRRAPPDRSDLLGVVHDQVFDPTTLCAPPPPKIANRR
jgi:hypothetical protein